MYKKYKSHKKEPLYDLLFFFLPTRVQILFILKLQLKVILVNFSLSNHSFFLWKLIHLILQKVFLNSIKTCIKIPIPTFLTFSFEFYVRKMTIIFEIPINSHKIFQKFPVKLTDTFSWTNQPRFVKSILSFWAN